MGDHVNMMDKDLNIIWANEATKNVFGDDIVGKKCFAVFHQRKKPCAPYPCHVIRTFKAGKIHHQETNIVKDDGQTLTYYCTANVALKDESGKPKAIIEVCQDISEYTQLKRELQESRDQLERKVIERTKELETKTKRLEELNTALKVLSNKRQEDKKELEENILTNVKGLVLPYIGKINKTQLNEQQKTFMNIIETNIEEIISPFYKKLILKYSNLTPTELNICNLIKDGNTTKQIAKILNISAKTVDTHRKNIRRKIGIENKKINLRSHLLNLY
jgi:DNA-binding CsgD family transcriptional regulator